LLVTKSAIRPGSNFNRQGGSIFHQRQHQYLQEDPATVLSMLWHGFPVLRLLAAWLAASAALFALFGWLERLTLGQISIGRVGQFSISANNTVLYNRAFVLFF